jgi:hypothetical protein
MSARHGRPMTAGCYGGLLDNSCAGRSFFQSPKQKEKNKKAEVEVNLEVEVNWEVFTSTNFPLIGFCFCLFVLGLT